MMLWRMRDLLSVGGDHSDLVSLWQDLVGDDRTRSASSSRSAAARRVRR
jgi:hypothetical protein